MLDGYGYLREALCSPVYEVAKATPVNRLARLSERLGQDVWLKREDLQPVHSFKLRGAYHKIASLPSDCPGVVAASAGNHAQGVALSARALGFKAIIVMPTQAPSIKVEAVKALGAEVVLFGDNFDAAKDHAQTLSSQQGFAFVAPFDDEKVIAGQGTLGLELIKELPKLDVLFLPVGGGGLAAGVAAVIKQLKPEIRVVAVEPDDAACFKAAFEAGAPVTLEEVGTFADGVAVKRIGSETFRVMNQFVDEAITVSNDAICAAIKDIFEDVRAVAEPAGALSLAGLKAWCEQHPEFKGQVGAVLSGANLNFHLLRQVSERCDLGEGTEAVLAVTIPERPGSFLALCRTLKGRAVTEFSYRYRDTAEAQILVSVRTGGIYERTALVADLEQSGFDVLDLSDNELAKLHVRYMVGGRPPVHRSERLYSFAFPEHPKALLAFLENLGSQFDISLFHYRHHGADVGRVLAAFADAENDSLTRHLDSIGYPYRAEDDNPAYSRFLC
ncbi:MAG: threonine ammonia-lyase, biosynthetic [Pseudomonadota bacterium]|uniref:L-threonine dehydratase n=1 Tax=Gallaecimonas pentaromativorans TaxID=584787 RepID=A0A3N1PIP0_9GAMM|nr:threonine ammonia-lyase, biosynthetic [Gallaecimonas pentaromativorans]MED5523801.1 threonine ammonia-lyase, biosynthetic [Pseudomonadota bacterium]ROQ27708.1 L-threonine ammonia-lyase [Gallaecimonas pentaromativorans]